MQRPSKFPEKVLSAAVINVKRVNNNVLLINEAMGEPSINSISIKAVFIRPYANGYGPSSSQVVGMPKLATSIERIVYYIMIIIAAGQPSADLSLIFI